MPISFDDLPSAGAASGSGGGVPISFDDLPAAKGAFQQFADAGGATVMKRGIGMMQLAQDAGLPVNKMFGVSPEQFKQAANSAVATQNQQAQGTGGLGLATSIIADPVNLTPLPGGLALRAGQGVIKGAGKLLGAGAYYGGLAGATGGEQDDTGLAGRAGEAAKDAAISAPFVLGVGGIASGAGKLVTPKLRALLADESGASGFGRSATVPTVDPAYLSVARSALKEPGSTADSILQTARDAQGGAIPLTLPEALNSDRMLKQQRVLGELSTQAGTDFNRFNDARLQTNIPYAKDELVSPSGAVPSTLTDAGGKVNSAAQGIIDDAIEARKAATAPEYRKIANDIVPDDALLQLRANPAFEESYQKVLGNDKLMQRTNVFKPQIPPELANLPPQAQQQALAQLGPLPNVKSTTGGLAPDSLAVIHNVKKDLQAQYANSTDKFGRATQDSIAYQQAAADTNRALESVNPKYATTNEDFAAQSDEIKALRESPLGKLASIKDPESAAKTFMNMSREQLQAVVPQLAQKDPDAVRSMASAMMREVTDKTDGSGIKNYINALSKNTLVKDKMQAILSPDAYAAQQELVGTLDKVLKGQTRNSETASKIETLKDINETPNIADFAEGALTAGNARNGITKWVRNVLGGVSGKINAQKHAALMQVFLSPDLDQLGRALAKVSGAQKEKLVLQYLGSKTGSATISGLESQGEAPNLKRPQLAAPTIENPPQSSMQDIINNASHASGISALLLSRIAQAESNGDPDAANLNSTAKGMFQFTKKTWGEMVDKYGEQTGITKADIFKPQANATMGALYARENADKLGKFLGRAPTAGEVYIAHHLGLSGAKTLIGGMDSKQFAASLLPDAAASNRKIFYNGLKPRSPAEVYQILNDKINGAT